MSAKNQVAIGGSVNNASIYNAHNLTVRIGSTARQASKPQGYPSGTIGANPLMRNYIKYLIGRYHHFRQADKSFGRGHRPFSYAVLFKNIEREFKAPAYFVLEARFPELADYLQAKVDDTVLGKRSRARGIANFSSWDEFQTEQTQPVG